MKSFIKAIFLFLFVIFSCKNNVEKKAKVNSATNEKYVTDIISDQKIEPKKRVQAYKRLTQITKNHKIGDTTSIILTKEYSIPENGELKQ
ncbi:hypothetical protein, partial [uncultured Aquimarina sp.]|uniref:hypothetical protein n=1 Tax=uncultured Aquimarina sp. TaxID=575652 RepID=UPI0026323FCE